jgi:reactive intermediate/imine deaminase
METAMKESIQTDQAPAAIGPYSQAVRCGDMVYISGQIPLSPETGQLIEGGVEEQIQQSFSNLKAVCEAAGGDLDQICKLTLYLTNLQNFSLVNRIMEERFCAPWPARAAIGVRELPKGAEFEVEAVLYCPAVTAL